MTKDEALKMALEALKIGYDYAADETQRFHVEMAGYKPKRHDAMDADVRQIDDAITAIREAQAQQKEPVAAQHRFRHPQKTMPDWSAWQPCKIKHGRPAWEFDSQGYEVEYRELYTSPQAKQWVGLTDEEIAVIAAACGGLASDFVVDVARAIEAKLKEKNT